MAGIPVLVIIEAYGIDDGLVIRTQAIIVADDIGKGRGIAGADIVFLDALGKRIESIFVKNAIENDRLEIYGSGSFVGNDNVDVPKLGFFEGEGEIRCVAGKFLFCEVGAVIGSDLNVCLGGGRGGSRGIDDDLSDFVTGNDVGSKDHFVNGGIAGSKLDAFA